MSEQRHFRVTDVWRGNGEASYSTACVCGWKQHPGYDRDGWPLKHEQNFAAHLALDTSPSPGTAATR